MFCRFIGCFALICAPILAQIGQFPPSSGGGSGAITPVTTNPTGTCLSYGAVDVNTLTLAISVCGGASAPYSWGLSSNGGSTPTGTAGGIDLSGTFPNSLHVIGLNGVTLSTLGAAILKINGSGVPSAALAGTDYQAALTTGTSGQYFKGDLTLGTLGSAAFQPTSAFDASGVAAALVGAVTLSSLGGVAPQTCTAPNVLIGVGASATCAPPLIITTGSVVPTSGAAPCGGSSSPPASLQGCLYIQQTSTNQSTNYWEAPGDTKWVDLTIGANIGHTYLFANLPPASLFPALTTVSVTDCISPACPAGGGTPGYLESFSNGPTSPYSWTLQPSGQGSSSGSGVQGASTVAGANAITLTQIYPDQVFAINLINGSNVATLTCAVTGGCIRHTYIWTYPTTGSATFTFPTQDHGGLNIGTSAGTGSSQMCNSADGGNNYYCQDGLINQVANAVSGTLAVNSTTVGVVPANMIGIGWGRGELLKPTINSSWCPLCSSSRVVALLTLLGTSGTIRINGFDSISATYGLITYSGTTSGSSTSNTIGNAQISQFAAMVCSLPSGWKVSWGVPYYNSYLGAGQPIATTAAEVAYVYGLLGPSGTACTNRLLGIEIGNEPDGDAGGLYNTAGSTGSSAANAIAFAQGWNAIANAIKASVSAATFVAPSVGTYPQATGANNYLGNFFTASTSGTYTNLQLLAGGEISQHYYMFGTTSSATISGLMSTDSNLPAMGTLLEGVAASYSLPIQMNETNTVANGGASGVSNTTAAALWAVNYPLLFETMIYPSGQSAIVNYYSGGGYSNTYSAGYSPIIDQSSGYVGVEPIFTGMYFASAIIGSGTMKQVTLTSNGVNMTGYAVVNGGKTTVVVDVRDAVQNSNVTITIPNTVSGATEYLMTSPSLSDTCCAVNIQGVTINNAGYLNASIVPTTVPLGSGNNNVTLLVPAHSVAAVVMQ